MSNRMIVATFLAVSRQRHSVKTFEIGLSSNRSVQTLQ